MKYPEGSLTSNSELIFLVLITDDSFYHKKPYDEQSILYLLVRFMTDLSSKIILAYD